MKEGSDVKCIGVRTRKTKTGASGTKARSGNDDMYQHITVMAECVNLLVNFITKSKSSLSHGEDIGEKIVSLVTETVKTQVNEELKETKKKLERTSPQLEKTSDLIDLIKAMLEQKK